MSRVICISREYGSGGHEVAVKAAALLGIPCLDKELMEQAIADSGLPRELLQKAEEKRTNSLLYNSVYQGDRQEFYGMAPGDIVFELEKQYILEQAGQGDCIIVGRCAEEILKGTEHLVVNIFITAPFSYRMERKRRETLGNGFARKDFSIGRRAKKGSPMDDRNLETEIRRIDKQRRAYYEYHTGKDWGLPYNYDVCFNSASMGVDRIARLIAESFGKIIKEDA